MAKPITRYSSKYFRPRDGTKYRRQPHVEYRLHTIYRKSSTSIGTPIYTPKHKPVNDLSVNQLFQWPTIPEYVTSPSINELPRLTGTDWPNNSNTQATISEIDKSTLSSSPAYPQVNHPVDSSRKDQESAEIHRFDRYGGNRNPSDKSDTGHTQSQVTRRVSLAAYTTAYK